MNNKKFIFTFRNYDWMLATTFEIINEELNNEITIFWAHWAENLNFPREFLISEKIKNVRMKKRVFNSDLIDKLNKNSKKSSLNFIPLRRVNLATDQEIILLSRTTAYLELIARIRESKPDTEKYFRTLNRLESSYIKTYSAALETLMQMQPTTVYLYNGRFLQERAVSDCCDRLGIKVIFFERFNPSWDDRYYLFNESTHSPSYRSRIMLDFGAKFQKDSPQKFINVGAKWFNHRELGLTQHYTAKQSISSELKLRRPFYVFFHSSEDELITTDLISETWSDQITTIRKLVNVVATIGTHDLVIRIHPNLNHKSLNEINLWKNLGIELTTLYSWITFLSQESQVNSYFLIDKSDAVITVGSTIGVEAAYKEKKSILIGRAFHENMDITLNPVSENELRQSLLQNLNIEDMSKRKENALKYAIFHELGGVNFEYVKLDKKRRLVYFYSGIKLSNSFSEALVMKIEIFLKKIFKWLKYYFSTGKDYISGF